MLRELNRMQFFFAYMAFSVIIVTIIVFTNEDNVHFISSNLAKIKFTIQSKNAIQRNAKNFAVMGADNNAVYLFPSYITVRVWKRLGIESIFCFAGTEETFTARPESDFILQQLKNEKVQMIFLDTKLAPKHTITQTCRMFVASSPSLDIQDNDTLITSDSDLWPFHFNEHIPHPPKQLFLYNSRCCGLTKKPNGTREFPMYPMGTIAMSARLWREILGVSRDFLKDGDALAKLLYSEFDVDYIKNGQGKPMISASWFADQIMISDRLDTWLNQLGNRELLEELPLVYPGKRVDRANWPSPAKLKTMDLSQYHDSHILHPLHADHYWTMTLPLLQRLFNENEMEEIQQYHRTFTAIQLTGKLPEDRIKIKIKNSN